jgi:Ca2+-binding RTX toxin-like protein
LSRAWWIPLVCLALLGLAPATSQAAVAYMDDNGVARAQGEPGESNDMSIRPGEDGVIFTDAAGIRPRDDASSCRALSPTEVTCLGDGGILYGEDGNDVLRDGGMTTGFGARGGPGDDQIFAGAAPAFLYGDDTRVRSDDGNDTIVGSSAAAPGGSASGMIWDDEINGGGGNDTLDGGPGADHVSGQGGNDTVGGGAGPDALEATTLLTEDGQDAPADAGDDTLAGDGGDDVVRAILGRDKADGGEGDDWLIAVDEDLGDDDFSADGIACGPGSDRVSAGVSDRVAVGCETLSVRIYCTGGSAPCKATGSLRGRKKGAKKPTTVAKVSKTVTNGNSIEFSLKKGTKVLGSSKKVWLTAEWLTKRGTKVVGGRVFLFQLVKG